MENYLNSTLNEFNQPIGEKITTEKPQQFKNTQLVGQHVQLEPIKLNEKVSPTRLEQLWEVIQSEPDARCWTYLPYNGFSTQDDLQQALSQCFGFSDSFHYFIIVNQQAVGWIALLNPRLPHAAIEIGNVYFSHRLKRSAAATEVIYLLLNTCFSQHFRRVEWKCDDFNAPSKHAACRFGFEYEGLFRQDRIAKGRNRNTAWFSILDSEWEMLKTAYHDWLDVKNFDANQKQYKRLDDLITLAKSEHRE